MVEYRKVNSIDRYDRQTDTNNYREASLLMI